MAQPPSLRSPTGHAQSHPSLPSSPFSPLTPGGLSPAPGGSLPVAASPFGGSPSPARSLQQLHSPATRSGTESSPIGGDAEEDAAAARLRVICRRIDTDGNGSISELEMIRAVQQDPAVAECVLPGIDGSMLLSDESCFDEIDAVFNEIAGGKQRIRYSDFIAHFRRKKVERSVCKTELRVIFDILDMDRSGSVSKLELVEAVQNNQKVAEFVMPHVACSDAKGNEDAFDAVSSVFEAIAGGKRRFDYPDFERHYSELVLSEPRQHPAVDRSAVRVFIIGPGFGLQLNPRQGASIVQAGFQVCWCHDVPNPEQASFPVHPYLNQIRAQMEEFRPDVLVAASKGGAYVNGLWRVGFWRGPTLLINAHPTCMEVPPGVTLVLCHGSNDEVYPTRRADLEWLVASGSPNRCFFYHTADSGLLPSGQRSRIGDRHNMESLLQHDLLPRLLEATLCPAGPEQHVLRTWRDRMTEDRLEAEAWLGYSPERVQRHWASHRRRGLDSSKLFDVLQGSEEFLRVATVFHAAPREPPAYLLSPQAAWDRVHILRVQRIENGLQMDGSIKPFHASLRRSLEDQELDFEPGTHTLWAFHGADDSAIESIVSNPVAGFQPLASGTRGASLWGLGTYFAREAKYVADGGFCGRPARDGSRRMLMCLLSTGMACLGDPQQKGVLPFRRSPHRYHCSVDSLSSPEIYIIQHAGAAQAAYLITFA